MCIRDRSLYHGQFPDDWKNTNTTPVYKAGDPKLTSNYRPISLLSIPSKLLERIVHNRLMYHRLTNSLLSVRQFGFRPGSSTQEALISATTDWHKFLDGKRMLQQFSLTYQRPLTQWPTRVCLSQVGVSGKLLQWFESYLLGRSQRVVLNGCSSTSINVRSSVPQGHGFPIQTWVGGISYLKVKIKIPLVQNSSFCSFCMHM